MTKYWKALTLLLCRQRDCVFLTLQKYELDVLVLLRQRRVFRR